MQRYFWPLMLGLLLCVFPFVAEALGLGFYISFVRRILIFALAATSLSLILGFGGMVALGHAAFLGLGAYTVVIMAEFGYSSAFVVWPAAMMAAAVFAAITGAISLRTRGVYFIMITLAFAQMAYYVFISLRQFGGEDGMSLYQLSSLGGVDLYSDVSFYYVVLAIFVAFFLVFSLVISSRFGVALQGIRENETRMSALGYPVYQIKLIAYVLSGTALGLAGALLANHNQFVSPSLLHWTQSANLLIMVLVGGLGMRWAGFLGASLMLILEEFLRMWTDFWHLPLGVLLLCVVFSLPGG
ncbi:branched-chain amino acid ABC transporter permease [Paenalcaligenes niemegkensis]|nr:branched-chain amino acid ABC transporter permease [Paenalcaligenes niemegkensis]MCQ9617226.1 branched-chain amino acid ABC transporter permease [Paenalcaligenes niemegkensis]